MAAMCGLQDYKKNPHIFVVLKLIIPITVVFMHLFWALRLLPKSQIGWEHFPTVPIFLEPWVYLSLSVCPLSKYLTCVYLFLLVPQHEFSCCQKYHQHGVYCCIETFKYRTKIFKPMSVHEHTHQIKTYGERRRTNHVTVPSN